MANTGNVHVRLPLRVDQLRPLVVPGDCHCGGALLQDLFGHFTDLHGCQGRAVLTLTLRVSLNLQRKSKEQLAESQACGGCVGSCK